MQGNPGISSGGESQGIAGSTGGAATGTWQIHRDHSEVTPIRANDVAGRSSSARDGTEAVLGREVPLRGNAVAQRPKACLSHLAARGREGRAPPGAARISARPGLRRSNRPSLLCGPGNRAPKQRGRESPRAVQAGLGSSRGGAHLREWSPLPAAGCWVSESGFFKFESVMALSSSLLAACSIYDFGRLPRCHAASRGVLLTAHSHRQRT